MDELVSGDAIPMDRDDVIRIASFDIGKKNFAQYVEVMHRENIYNHRRFGSVDMIDDICAEGKCETLGVYDLRCSTSKREMLNIDTRRSLIKHLETFRSVWDTCDIFIIEQQYFRTFSSRKKKKNTEANIDAIKIAECTMMWFLLNYPDRKVEFIGSMLKTQALNAPKKMTKVQRKKWAEDQALDIYASRYDNDLVGLYNLRVSSSRIRKYDKKQLLIKPYLGTKYEYLAKKIVNEHQKLDDISDACVQCQAYKIKLL